MFKIAKMVVDIIINSSAANNIHSLHLPTLLACFVAIHVYSGEIRFLTKVHFIDLKAKSDFVNVNTLYRPTVCFQRV